MKTIIFKVGEIINYYYEFYYLLDNDDKQKKYAADLELQRVQKQYIISTLIFDSITTN